LAAVQGRDARAGSIPALAVGTTDRICGVNRPAKTYPVGTTGYPTN